ncbi:MAG: serine--tRNA ligase [Flavobacteriales bacterium]|jgi:seryl-tRNA synthetase
MLQINKLRENTEGAIELLKVRNKDFTSEINGILAADDKRKASQAELDSVLAESNRLSKEIGDLFKSGKAAEASVLKEETVLLKEKSHALKEEMTKAEEEIKRLLYIVPNIPHVDVPSGKDDSDNKKIDEEGSLPDLHAEALPHWEIADKYGLIDFELGVKISGAGFPVYRGKGAKLQRALINFFLDEAAEAGYEEIIPPHLVNEASGIATGQLPDKEGQMYHTEVDNLYLIPTGEVPITNVFRDVIIKETEFSHKLCGYTPCFRREAGSYGKDVRGLNRLHQFDKVEIVRVEHPDNSYAVLDDMVEHVKSLLRKLELPFRTLRLCGGDLGFTAALTFDLEVYSAAQKRWLEVSSISNFETYQANRLKLRFKNKVGKTQLAHTLNGSALALPRILAALLENNQDEKGIRIPEALVKYTGFDYID